MIYPIFLEKVEGYAERGVTGEGSEGMCFPATPLSACNPRRFIFRRQAENFEIVCGKYICHIDFINRVCYTVLIKISICHLNSVRN